MLCSRRIYGALACTLLLAQPMPVKAQSILQSHEPSRTIGVEVLRTNHADQSMLSDYNLTLMTSALFVSGRFATPFLNVVIDLPIAHFNTVGDFYAASTVIGNPYVGVEYALTTATRLSAGARIPLARTEEFGTIVGILADPNRAEAFLADLATVRVSASHIVRPLPQLEIFGELGSSVWIPTDTDYYADWIPPQENAETLLDYGAQGRMAAGAFLLRGGVTGRLELTEGGSLSERSIHHALLEVGGRLGRVSTGLHLMLPLDKDARDVIDYTFGLSVRVRY